MRALATQIELEIAGHLAVDLDEQDALPVHPARQQAPPPMGPAQQRPQERRRTRPQPNLLGPRQRLLSHLIGHHSLAHAVHLSTHPVGLQPTPSRWPPEVASVRPIATDAQKRYPGSRPPGDGIMLGCHAWQNAAAHDASDRGECITKGSRIWLIGLGLSAVLATVLAVLVMLNAAPAPGASSWRPAARARPRRTRAAGWQPHRPRPARDGRA